ncbi:hypothetical protein [Streptosporangium brasiliense]|uniref:Sugar phosphate isomerase/epimerase n=1 Tax=Streptosporangium brasiliense TaxID=47480 RepID=A0ABT9RG07_9ACTN|nr:hypothetical protein [Streptosporangium brasiliense]MDP9867786.1 sugar phosphate isomerase/epimerase [Streptosporangium brasiliense]
MKTAAAPISWGVCEVPGWGRQLDRSQVLAEMRDLGLTATEGLGAAGYSGWYVLEQDVVLGSEPPAGAGPLDDVRASLAFLRSVA